MGLGAPGNRRYSDPQALPQAPGRLFAERQNSAGAFLLNREIISSASCLGISYSNSYRLTIPGSLLNVMNPLSPKIRMRPRSRGVREKYPCRTCIDRRTSVRQLSSRIRNLRSISTASKPPTEARIDRSECCRSYVVVIPNSGKTKRFISLDRLYFRSLQTKGCRASVLCLSPLDSGRRNS